MTKPRPTETIPTNLRLLAVLEEVAQGGVPVTPTDVNARLGLPKPTIHRLFATLEAEGFLERDLDGRTYSPGPRFRTMATGVLSSLRVRTARLAVLRKLSETIGETCNISLPDRDAMIYLERVETEWPLRIQLPVGSKVPFYCTASGKMYLSTLPRSHVTRYAASERFEAKTPHTITSAEALLEEVSRVRQRGYSLDTEEFMDGMVALAVPVLDRNKRLIATLSFHAPTLRFDTDKAARFLPNLQAAAADLSSLLLDAGAEASPA
ncbi:IclR family transcriptional regulator [Thalassorhabdomicrobium marinisediminis]|uniref:ArsR family transcriptional regulator n=1 Tax=Thalassorhabdomicrobium marinisediminis TaxID=2170577 RepID=A0A2T7FYH9_9RHOB|nr:IclR family transcriptional regulator [Thalassorhabdomicrobium marinisediminis]PVA07219.1 ArsR family transcriptional regulator [Thalassorhabdomicrobium marinisediminis]